MTDRSDLNFLTAKIWPGTNSRKVEVKRLGGHLGWAGLALPLQILEGSQCLRLSRAVLSGLLLSPSRCSVQGDLVLSPQTQQWAAEGEQAAQRPEPSSR